MKIHWNRFNIYLSAVLTSLLLCGCLSAESKAKHQSSEVRLHLEMTGQQGGSTQVPIYRDNPVMINVEHDAFLTEGSMAEARVIEAVGGFAISIRFDRRGSWLLEQYTGSNKGKRLAVFAQFVSPYNPKLSPGRWLAAPIISQRITDGILRFTGDLSIEEAHSFVRGLNNVAHKNGTDKEENSSWW